MRLHRMLGGVQAQGCAALRSMGGKDSYRTEIANVGGIQLIAEALELHIDFAPLVHQACWALRILAVNDSNRAKIGKTGAIELLVGDIMKMHSANADVIEEAASALRSLALNSDDNKQRIADAGALVFALLSSELMIV